MFALLKLWGIYFYQVINIYRGQAARIALHFTSSAQLSRDAGLDISALTSIDWSLSSCFLDSLKSHYMRTTARETLIKVNTGNSFQYDFLDGVEWVYCLSNGLQKKKKTFWCKVRPVASYEATEVRISVDFSCSKIKCVLWMINLLLYS